MTKQHTIAYSKSHRKNHIDARGKIDDEANTLSTGDGCANQSTGNYVFTKVEDMTDIKLIAGQTAPNQPRKSLYKQKGRVYSTEGISPTTTEADKNAHIVENEEDMQIAGELRTDEGIRTFKDNIYGTIRTKDAGGDKVVVDSEPEIRIRKLVPVECERLQGYPDGWTSKGINDKGEVVDISNAQRYKMCGNGISSPVPAELFPAVLGTEPIRVMSLFSGCGGTELLLPSNFEVVGHCEIDKYASSVLRYHYPNVPNFKDVTKLADRDDLPEFDLLVGGFPCQSWSIAGLRKGFDDDRGQLIYNVYDIIRKHRPKAIVLENVKGLLSKDKGDAFEAIMEYLSSLGYDLDFEVVNSKHFGLAQNRERVFIFGKLKQ